MSSRRKYSPRFLAEILKELPPWADTDFCVVHREVFEDDSLMVENMRLLMNHFELSQPGYEFRVRFYRLNRVKD